MAVAAVPHPPRSARMESLLDIDAELGAGLHGERLAAARSALVVRVVRLPRGEWAGARASPVSADNVGLLVVDGALAREVVLADTVSSELLGPGDLVRPWAGDGEIELLARQFRWQVLAEAEVAVLGRQFGAALARFPEVNFALFERACAHARRLATTQAISHMNSVERRVLSLFWHLAERWGRVTSGGVLVPLALSHRQLGELVGARRPTISAAVATLRREESLVRRPDATWLLTGDPPSGAAPPPAIPHRRQLLHSVA
jgi:CRP/FNR family transcriptional regulator, cyclic AMP receptor protein